MSSEKNEFCPGEILYASSYGGTEDYTFVNSITATAVWLEAVKEMKAVMCESNQTFWMDFDLNSAMVLAEDSESIEIDPYLLFARRYCYRKFCETYCGYFGLTEIFGYLYRIFSNRHKDPPDEFDLAYANFVDSLLDDVRFIVCLRKHGAREKDDTVETQNNGIVVPQINSTDTPVREMGQDDTTPPSLFSFVDNYIEDDLLEMEMDNINMASPLITRTPTPETGPFVSDLTYDAHSTADSQTRRRLTPRGKSLADCFVNSPMAADTAPDTSLQEVANAGFAEMASMGQNDNDFAQMPLTILYDPVTGGERVISYEPQTTETQYTSDTRESVFVLDGLFDEPSTELSGVIDKIEITYAVGPLGKVLSFTAIDINNENFNKTGRRGLVKLDLNEFLRAIHSIDSNARVLNSLQLDLYSFEVELASLHPGSLLKNRRKFYMRFVKSENDK